MPDIIYRAHAFDHDHGDFSPDDLYLLSQIFVGCKISDCYMYTAVTKITKISTPRKLPAIRYTKVHLAASSAHAHTGSSAVDVDARSTLAFTSHDMIEL